MPTAVCEGYVLNDGINGNSIKKTSDLAPVAQSNDYNDLYNLPSVPVNIVVANGRSAANETATTDPLAFFVPVATRTTFRMSGVIHVISGTGSVQLVVTYADETNTPQTVSMGLGVVGPGFNNADMYIDAVSGTNVVVKAVVTGSVVYNAVGTVEQLWT